MNEENGSNGDSESPTVYSDSEKNNMTELQHDSKAISISDSKTEDESKLLFPVASGALSDLPPKKKNVVRIFLSSTFTDMKVERNMLMSSVYPRLKKYCLENYKLEFQVVDMRWGVQDQASDDHSTSELCMREIYNCQRESAGPNFVCFLGDRYGTRYLKKHITEEHWIILVSRIRSSEVKQLLDVWYKLDTNSATAHRILQPISYVENGKEQWQKSSSIMYNALRDAAIQAMNDGELSTEIAQTFIRSVTEEEIDCAGMLSDTQNDNKPKCLAFIRRINNINIQHAKAGRFVDLNDSKEIDEEGQGLLNKLKDELRSATPAANLKEYSIDWSDDEGIHADHHQEYLKRFCEDFYEEVKRLIDTSAQQQDVISKSIYENDVTHEVLNHSKQALDKLSKVVPRSDILDKVKAYITGDSDQPLVIHGHSGCGKTSIMASVAKEAGQWLSDKDDKPETAVILRFLGTTPSSSDIEHLLRSLIAQLNMIDKQSSEKQSKPASSLKELVNKFHMLIRRWSKIPRQLVVVIDSVDQLRRHDVAYNLSWLPGKLPKNVRFVISTLPDIYGILESAQSLDIPEDNFVEVKALDETSAWTIIDKWLDMSDRKISQEQRYAIAEAFKNRSLPPLYIKLVFDILVKWTSYSQIVSIPTDVISCMDKLFTDLEITHGKVPVQLALAYLTCCPGGISETELEDVLSIDDTFLTIVYQYHIPPVRRIPPTLWVRMRNDIRDYLVEKESNGVTALSWYHRQFTEYAARRYASEKGDNTRHCMDTLCEYFTSKWSETPKSFTYTQQQMKKLNISDPFAVALRYVTPQPTRYGRHRFNTRKISVLSQLWSNSIMKDEVYKNSAAYIMDIEFLTGKYIYDSWSNIRVELSALIEHMDKSDISQKKTADEERFQVEFGYIRAVLKMYSGLISMAPLALSAQLFACLQDKYNLSTPIPPSDSTLPNIAWFLTQLITGKGVEICPLVPVSQTLPPPGGKLLIARQQQSLSHICSFTYKGKSAVASFAEEMVIHIIGEDGVITELLSMPIPTEPDCGTYLSFGDNDDYLFTSFSGTFCLISLTNRRVECYVDEIIVDPDDEATVCCSEAFTVFLHPHLNGKDSIMFYTWEEYMVTIYSLKSMDIVWFRSEPSDEDDPDPLTQIFHASLHDTKDSDIKCLVIVFTQRTEFYQVKLLEDGGVDVTKTHESPNSFKEADWETEDQLYTFTRSNKDLHWSRNAEVIVPARPNGCGVMVSETSGVKQNTWTEYKLSRDCVLMMAGKLKSGRNILATYSEVEDTYMVDLYTVNSHDQLLHSASLPSQSDVEFVYVAPESDVLVVVNEKASFYLLSEMEWPLLEVTPACKFPVGPGVPEDMVVDPRGYLVATFTQSSTCKFWDVTAPWRDEAVQKQPSAEAADKVAYFSGQSNYCVSLQHNGHVWDFTTNNYIGYLPGNRDDSPADAVNCYSGGDGWDNYISIAYGTDLVVIGASPGIKKNKWKVIHKQEIELCTHNCTYDSGMLMIDDQSGLLYHFKIDEMTNDLGEGHTLQFLKSDGALTSWEEVGFIAMEYCYADELLIVGGNLDKGDVEETPKRKDDGAPVPCILVYETAGYTPLKKYLDKTFLHAVYFKNFGTVILASEDSTQLFSLDPKTMELNSTSFSKDFGVLSFLENYDRSEGMYNHDTEPYLYIISSKVGLVKLDVTKVGNWNKDEGVTYLGPSPSFYGECRVSHDRKYIAGIKNSLTAIELSKLVDDNIHVLGEITFQGSITKFYFSRDDRYMTVCLDSGQIVCLKLLDATSDDLLSQVNELKCTHNPVCETKEDMMKDKRWTSMKGFTTESTDGHRDTNTLHNFIQNLVTSADKSDPKNLPYPLVGSAELGKSLPEGFTADDGSYVPAITSKVESSSPVTPETDKLETTEQVMAPRPPSAPKPPTLPVHKIKSKSQPQAGLPADLLSQIRSDARALKNEEDIVPDNLKLYMNLPVDERGKRLDNALSDINSKYTTACTIL